MKQPQAKTLPPLDFDEFRKDLREDLIKILNDPDFDDLGKEHLVGYAGHIADECADAYREKIHRIAEGVAREVAGLPRLH